MPDAVRFRTRHELILEMLDERGPLAAARLDRRRRRTGPLLVVSPGIAGAGRVLFAGGAVEHRGARPDARRSRRTAVAVVGRRVPFTRVDRWCAALPETAWQTIEVRDGEKGPVVVQVAWTLVQARTEGRVVGRGGVAGGLPRAARGRHLEARLPAVERGAGHAAGGIRPGVQSGASDRGMPATGQGRGGLGRLPSADVGGLAPSSNLVAARDLVPDAGNQAGKKSGPRR